MILRGPQFPKRVKNRTVKLGIVVESQECVIMCVNPLSPLLVTVGDRQSIK